MGEGPKAGPSKRVASKAPVKGKAKNLGGRPKLEMDNKQFAQLVSMARIHCTAEECSLVLGISADTLDRRIRERGYAGFADFYRRHNAEGRVSLRRMQWKSAEEGNLGAQIWLGKQLLGQRDYARVETTGADGGPIQMRGKVDLSDLTAEERDALRPILEHRAGEASGSAQRA